jgi:hypothetical protein
VFGAGLLLVPGEGRLLSLYAVASGRARSLVTYADAMSVWHVLDSLDQAKHGNRHQGPGHYDADEAAESRELTMKWRTTPTAMISTPMVPTFLLGE